jgi:hypothetical protein
MHSTATKQTIARLCLVRILLVYISNLLLIYIEGLFKLSYRLCIDFGKTIYKCKCCRGRKRRDSKDSIKSNEQQRPIWMVSGLGFARSSSIGFERKRSSVKQVR